MDKIWLILQREYLTRVRKKSFVVMTLLAPVLLAALFVVPVLLASSDDDVVKVRVLDESKLLAPGLLAEADPAPFRFETTAGALTAEKARLQGQKGTVLLYVPSGLDLTHPTGVQLITASNLGLGQQSRLERLIKRQLENQRLTRAGVDPRVIDAARDPADFELATTRIDKTGEQSESGDLAAGLGYTGSFLIYMFIFLYGIQVMRGVIEEKTNRIVEVMISSVKPFELMMGKVLGIAAVGLTQFALWVILTTTLSTVVTSQFGIEAVTPAGRVMQTGRMTTVDAPTAGTTKAPASAREEKKQAAGEFLGLLQNQNWPLLLAVFVFYFLGGYLLYSALFGAVGSAVDSDTDAQQFMLPVTLPLIFTFIIAQTSIIRNPDGALATWMSLIPFTSPIAMVMRLPFGGVPGWQLALSMALLVGGFIGTIWLAGRIYRVGILMYGKKPTFRELGKWLFYKG
ncbi:MAG: ABC transporter permease [Hymenobacteraceae bacterium]|nr:ABC transporter permease [Hymenobacteraceae bacterium]